METQDLSVQNVERDKTVTSLSANNYNYDERIALLTPEEKEKYEKIGSTIKVTDVNSVQTFGSELSKTIAQSGDQLLTSVRSSTNNELVDLTNQLLGELNLINVDEIDPSNRFKNFLRRVPIVRSLVKTVESVLVKYDSISDNVEKISRKIDGTRVVAMRDNSTLRTIFDADKAYIAQMREYILAAKMKVKEFNEQIELMVANPTEYEAYDTKTLISFRNALEKRIADMQTTEYTLTQSLLQVEAIAAGNSELAQRADNIVNNVIPLWKNQLSNAIIIQNQRNGIEAQQKITEATNKMLRTNAENIRKNSIAVAKANEDPVISLETLQHTTNELIQTIKEVKQIHDQGAANRKTLEESLKGYAEQLDHAISENA
jgi:uncharacterized protein YaaN involved in tellurite resistance